MSIPSNKIVSHTRWSTQKLVSSTERLGMELENGLWVESDAAFVERVRILLGEGTTYEAAAGYVASHLENPPPPRFDPPPEEP